jgi:putative toxin-antitoxin system antitoxin component (TIGR02293 family)
MASTAPLRGRARTREVAGGGAHGVAPAKADTPAILRLLAAGMKWAQVAHFMDQSGLTTRELAGFLELPERTFARRRESGRLLKAESERMLRLMEIFSSATELFDGDAEATRQWLTEPAYGLGQARPIDYAQSDFGGREVRNLIGRLLHGVFS